MPRNPRTDTTRVVVTGLGVVSPLGPLPDFWRRLTTGEHGIGPSDDLKTRRGTPATVARVTSWEPKEHVHVPALRRMDRLSRMIVSATRAALTDARLALTTAAADSAGMVVGTAYGNVVETDQFIRRLQARGPGLANALTFPNTVLNAPAGYAAIDRGLRGPNVTVAHGEASGELALATAYDLIRSERADVMLAGAGDELAPLVFDIYDDLGLLSPNDGQHAWSSPFDRYRNGIVLGEGAAMLVLERAEHAAARGVEPYAELRGHTAQRVAATPHDWPATAAADPGDTARQLEHLGWRPGVTDDLVISCANSTKRLDAFETANLTRLLGAAASSATVTSLRGAIGDFGGAGAMSAAAAVLALRTGDLPRLGSLREPDPTCDLRLATLTRAPPAHGFERVLVSATPRGGGCRTLLFQRA